MDSKGIIEIIAALTILVAVWQVIQHRVKQEMGMGVRAIQFLAMATLPPLILILALEGILEKSAVGALIGSLVGYLFSNIGKYDIKKANEDK